MSKKSGKKKGKSRIGRPPKHGGYSLMVQGGKLPENRKHIRLWLSGVREGLITDLGPTENDLTTAQRVLVDRVISKLCILRCVEEYIKGTCVMKGQDLSPVLKKSYLSYNRAVLSDLQALGINIKKGDEALSPLEIAAEIDREKEGKKDE